MASISVSVNGLLGVEAWSEMLAPNLLNDKVSPPMLVIPVTQKELSKERV